MAESEAIDKNCAYIFDDLFLAAYGRAMSDTDRNGLKFFNQKQINETVRAWAELAGWQTQDRLGSDEIIYTAFLAAVGDVICR